jgi:GH25 family lysozyme M1 (1,4-beta-N-acetylmuramidase)
MLKGFDVSHYQGAVNWSTLKTEYDIAWGAAKATEAEGGRDVRFSANWQGMKDAGLVRMAYSYGHPDSSPIDDAQAFLSYVTASGGWGPTDIAVMDMEVNDLKLPLLQVRDWLAGWADIVTKATGRKPFLYAGSGWIRNNTTLGLKAHYAAWWWPKYPTAYDGDTSWPQSISGFPTPNNWGDAPDIWQFSQTFAGDNMDASVANMTLDDLKTRGRSVTPKPTPADNSFDWEAIMALYATKDDFEKALTKCVSDGTYQGNQRYWRDFFTDGSGTGDAIFDNIRAIKTNSDQIATNTTPPTQ